MRMPRRRWRVVPKGWNGNDDPLWNELLLYWTRKQAERYANHLNARGFFLGYMTRFVVQDRRKS